MSFFDLVMDAYQIDPEQPVLTAKERENILTELRKLRELSSEMATDRERLAAKSLLEERRRELELLRDRNNLIQDLEELRVGTAKDLKLKAMEVSQRAAKYVSDAQELSRPDMGKVGLDLRGAGTDPIRIIQVAVGDSLMETESGIRLSDEKSYETLRAIGKQTNLWELDGDKVILGERLDANRDRQAIFDLKSAVRAVYPAWRDLQTTIEQSERVQQEILSVSDDADRELDKNLIGEALGAFVSAKTKTPQELAKEQQELTKVVEESDLEIEKNQELYDMMLAELKSRPQSKVRSAYAEAVNNPYFQMWAESNGFDIGTSDGTEQSYVEGPDDVQAITLFAIQNRTGARLAKRRGRTVSIPGVTGKEVPLDSVDPEQRKLQRQARARLGDLEKNKSAVANLGQTGFLFLGDDNNAYVLKPDGFVEVMAQEDQQDAKALLESGEYAPESMAEYGVAVGNIAKTVPKEQETVQDEVFIELRLTPDDIRKNQRRLEDPETGIIKTIPLDTKLEVLEDIRVPLTRKIAEKAEARFEQRQLRAADKRFGIRDEPAREKQPEDYEDELVADVEGLPDVKSPAADVVKEVGAQFEDSGQVNLGETAKAALERDADPELAQRAALEASSQTAAERARADARAEAKKAEQRIAAKLAERRKKAAEEAPAAEAPAEAPQEAAAAPTQTPSVRKPPSAFDTSGMSRLDRLRLNLDKLRLQRQANRGFRKLDKARRRAGETRPLGRPSQKSGQIRKRLEAAKESREAANEAVLGALSAGSMEQAAEAQKSAEKALKREQRLAKRQGRLEARVDEMERTDPEALAIREANMVPRLVRKVEKLEDKQKKRQERLAQVAKMQQEREAQAANGGE